MSEIYTIPEISLDSVPLDIDFKAIHNKAFIDVSEELKPQPVAISIGQSEYKGKSYPIPFGSYGDFSCIVGASKATVPSDKTRQRLVKARTESML